MAVVNLNNDIKQLTAAERHEVERILREASQQIRKNDVQLMDNCEIMAQIDLPLPRLLGI